MYETENTVTVVSRRPTRVPDSAPLIVLPLVVRCPCCDAAIAPSEVAQETQALSREQLIHMTGDEIREFFNIQSRGESSRRIQG